MLQKCLIFDVAYIFHLFNLENDLAM